MAIRLDKPWLSYTEQEVAGVPGHMGVYELGNAAGDVILIGVAGGRSLFGLRGELAGRLEDTDAVSFRYEVNAAYLTRYRELLMVHMADHGGLPVENVDKDARGLGRMSPHQPRN